MSDVTPGLFSIFGVELEYMLVDQKSLDVRPICDELLKDVAGEYVCDVTSGETCWSNELVLHLVELKIDEPARRLEPLPAIFQRQVEVINERLQSRGACLMPTGMHPWMNPARETRLWPHEYHEVYETYNRIFNCHAHGWANLQSVHLNLPFCGDDEFGSLHAAIRTVLPLLPALSASSPLKEAHYTNALDTRLETYRANSRQFPLITGLVVPERVYTHADYESEILQPMYAQIASVDPDGTLQHEWLNSRGAISRFERNAIEIRVMDVQECPLADVAICALVVAVLEDLVNERWVSQSELRSLAVGDLSTLLDDTTRHADRAMISDVNYLRMFGWPGNSTCMAGELWQHLAQTSLWPREHSEIWRQPLEMIFHRGPLARRIMSTLGHEPTREGMEFVYRALCRCLADGHMFEGSTH